MTSVGTIADVLHIIAGIIEKTYVSTGRQIETIATHEEILLRNSDK